MANNIDLTICAPEPSFRRFRCFAWLIWSRSPTGASAPKHSCSRFASLTLRTPHRPPVSLCFSDRLIFRLRTESAFQAAPVFRMAYSAPTAHRAVSSETLMLQVRSAHPPMPHQTSSSSCSGVPVGLFGKPKRSTFRFASLTLRCRTEPALRAAPVFRSAYFPKKLFSFFSKTLDLQPLRGLRWAGEASLPPAPLSPAPAVLIFPLCKRRRICFQADRQDATAPE